MATLTYDDVEYLYRGLNTKFRHTPTRSTKRINLSKQFFLRDIMKTFIDNQNNINKTLHITPQDGELIKKKLEYTFTKRKCTQDLLYKLTK